MRARKREIEINRWPDEVSLPAEKKERKSDAVERMEDIYRALISGETGEPATAVASGCSGDSGDGSVDGHWTHEAYPEDTCRLLEL